MTRLWSKAKGLYGKLVLASIGGVCFMQMLSQRAWAGGITWGNDYGNSSKKADEWVTNIGGTVVLALMGVFFIGGVVLAGMGIFAFANKDSNQQGAQGAWKKIAAGAMLMAFGVILGVLKQTVMSSGGQ